MKNTNWKCNDKPCKVRNRDWINRNLSRNTSEKCERGRKDRTYCERKRDESRRRLTKNLRIAQSLLLRPSKFYERRKDQK